MAQFKFHFNHVDIHKCCLLRFQYIWNSILGYLIGWPPLSLCVFWATSLLLGTVVYVM